MPKVMIYLVVGWIVFFSCGLRGIEKQEKLKWMKLQDAQAAWRKDKKPILIDLYTDWCGWCKVMDKKTYSDKKVIAYIEENFYPVKLDAETNEAVSWSGKSYLFNPSYRTNDFAIFITRGKLSYPSTVIIPGGGTPQAIPGYLTPNQLEIILKYFGEGENGKVSFDQYQKTFKSTW